MEQFDPNPEINHDNLHKHEFSLTTAQAVFCDPYMLPGEYNEKHSEEEPRFAGISMLPDGKITVVTYTMRGEK